MIADLKLIDPLGPNVVLMPATGAGETREVTLEAPVALRVCVGMEIPSLVGGNLC